MANPTYCYSCGRSPAYIQKSLLIDWRGDVAKVYASRPHCENCAKEGGGLFMLKFIFMLALGAAFLAGVTGVLYYLFLY